MSITSQARQRINALLDNNSFVEIGALITARATDFNLKQTETPSDGVITGYGVIDGNLVYVYSQDATVLSGSVGEMHSKKIVNLYNLAMKTGAPVIGLLDSAGLRLQEAMDALNSFGEIYLKQTMASGVIPQISAVFGNCGGGLAMISALSDFSFMEENKGKLFVNSPNSLDGNTTTKCDSATAVFQSEEAGLVDIIGNEEHIIKKIRELVTLLPASNEDDNSYEECMDNLNRSCPELEKYKGDTEKLLKAVSDENLFYEIKANYGKEMVTGFIKLNGATVGAIANRSEVLGDDETVKETFGAFLTSKGCEKAAGFVEFCDAFNIPIVTFTNTKGFEATICSEKKIAKAAGKLIYAFGNATVPKVNVIIDKALGSTAVAMNSKSIGADLTIAWPDAEIGTMDANLAAKILCDKQGSDEIEKCAKEYQALQTSAIGAAKRGYVDQIIQIMDTRKYLIGAFEMLFTKREERPGKKHGTV